VDVIIGMSKWEEAALVAAVGNKEKVPIISFAARVITPPQMERRWPFLIQMANNGSSQIKCVADIVGVYQWKRVVVIYEDGAYASDSGMSALLLSKALQDVDSEIDYRLVLPPASSLSSPKRFVLDELLKLQNATKSRVFIVLQSSLSMATHLFREAKNLGFMGSESAWIITDSVTSSLNSVDDSTISSMEGALGIKTYYSTSTDSYKDFYALFSKEFQSEYPEEANPKPGIHALRAYDSIRIISQASNNISNFSSAEMLLRNIASSSFSGLSGEIRFEGGKLLQTPPKLRIVNVRNKRYEELDFWTPYDRFSKGLVTEKGRQRLAAPVIWPAGMNLNRPKGWAMPTVKNPLIIGVPGRTSFQKFVNVTDSNKDDHIGGWCIEVFKMVLSDLNYDLPYKLVAFNSTYDELVYGVFNKVTISTLPFSFVKLLVNFQKFSKKCFECRTEFWKK
jgi:ionotropic glutamate receptor